MGIHNRQRRAAKRRKRDRERGGGPTGPGGNARWHDNVAAELADIVAAVIHESRRDRTVLAYFAVVLLGGAGSSLRPWVSVPYVMRVLANLTASLQSPSGRASLPSPRRCRQTWRRCRDGS